MHASSAVMEQGFVKSKCDQNTARCCHEAPSLLLLCLPGRQLLQQQRDRRSCGQHLDNVLDIEERLQVSTSHPPAAAAAAAAAADCDYKYINSERLSLTFAGLGCRPTTENLCRPSKIGHAEKDAAPCRPTPMRSRLRLRVARPASFKFQAPKLET